MFRITNLSRYFLPFEHMTPSSVNLNSSLRKIIDAQYVRLGECASESFFRFEFDRIISGNRELQLAEPITATIVSRGDICVMENKELGIISMSTDSDKCLEDFKDEVFFIWSEYGKAEDDKLTDGAKELKRRFLRYVKA